MSVVLQRTHGVLIQLTRHGFSCSWQIDKNRYVSGMSLAPRRVQWWRRLKPPSPSPFLTSSPPSGTDPTITFGPTKKPYEKWKKGIDTDNGGDAEECGWPARPNTSAVLTPWPTHGSSREAISESPLGPWASATWWQVQFWLWLILLIGASVDPRVEHVLTTLAGVGVRPPPRRWWE